VLVGYGPEEGGKRRRRGPIGRREGAVDETPTEEAEEEPEEEKEAVRPPLRAVQEAEAEADEEAVADKQEAEPSTGRAQATPPVRKMARDLGVDIDTVRGTGPGGRVTREDVQSAAKAPAKPAAAQTPAQPAAAQQRQTAQQQQPAASAAPKPAPLQPVQRRTAGVEEEERIPVRAIRRSIAKQMVRSWTELVHVTEWCTIDATELMQIREQLSAAPEANGRKISPLPIVVKALGPAVEKWPMANSSWESDGDNANIVLKKHLHVGIAADTDRGLLVPVVKHADQLNVYEISQEISRLVASARDSSIGLEDLKGSTITITNVGSFGMEAGTPIINYPETGIVTLGAITKRPWIVGGEIVPRQVMTIAFTFDHRVLDGAYAGRFLRYLGDLIEHPARLLGLL
jgi:pyruvate dehydrogenase E2 component (dihydrolipoamide acetyltransferase)